MLCGCYRKDEAADPQIYAAAVGAVLDEYDDEIVALVTDPRTGLASKCQWLPTVKEVRDLCEEIKESIASTAKRKRDLEVQFAERDRYETEQATKRNRSPEEQARVDAMVAETQQKLRTA